MRVSKCYYCGKSLTYDKDYCNNSCKEKYDKFFTYAEKWKKTFCILLAVIFLSFFISSLIIIKNNILGNLLFYLTILFLDLLIFIFPFATPETFNLLGVKRSILLVRILAVVISLFPLYSILSYFI